MDVERIVAGAEKRAFAHGYLMAVSTMLHQHGCTVTAEDALRDAGFKWSEVKSLDMDDFDLKVLRPVFRQMERRDKYDRQRARLNEGQG